VEATFSALLAVTRVRHGDKKLLSKSPNDQNRQCTTAAQPSHALQVQFSSISALPRILFPDFPLIYYAAMDILSLLCIYIFF